MAIIDSAFFDRDACSVARELLGCIIRRKYRQQWLAARIIETEAYYLTDKGSHASLGMTAKRKAMFMPAGTIYMYYARGKDSLNVSTRGAGNAVLIKSAFPHQDRLTDENSMATMKSLNPSASGQPRANEKLCNGQTLLCQSLNLKVTDWDQQNFQPEHFYIDDTGERPERIIQTTRLGITDGRDADLPYRFVEYDYAQFCTSNPLNKRGWVEDIDYRIVELTNQDGV